MIIETGRGILLRSHDSLRYCQHPVTAITAQQPQLSFCQHDGNNQRLTGYYADVETAAKLMQAKKMPTSYCIL